MRSALVVFPASNCDRDVAVALEKITGTPPQMVWHGETELPDTDLIVLPGGFSYGDYLRAGAMAARSPIMGDVLEKGYEGVPVLGICNGFQILTEAGLLPGVLMRNVNLRFVLRQVRLKVANADTIFTSAYGAGAEIAMPVAHHDGNYFTDAAMLERIEGEGQVAFRYADNPNGSLNDIAGITDRKERILGMMPHPERAIEVLTGGADGRGVFESLMGALS